jgi:hypothetical protein
MGEIHRDNRERVFDWHRAAELIREMRPEEAAAGLSGDWEWTGGPIFRNGRHVPKDDTYTFLSSTWAIPELDLDGDFYDCWIWLDESPEWDAETYWPVSALEILYPDGSPKPELRPTMLAIEAVKENEG